MPDGGKFPPGPRPQRPARVLIVDDDASMRECVRLILARSRQFEVVAEARDGQEGIEEAAAHRPDLVLLDLDMPRMGGLEALPSIRRVAPGAQVVLFSGRTRESLGRPWQQLGAAGFIDKDEDWLHVIGKLVLVAARGPSPGAGWLDGQGPLAAPAHEP